MLKPETVIITLVFFLKINKVIHSKYTSFKMGKTEMIRSSVLLPPTLSVHAISFICGVFIFVFTFNKVLYVIDIKVVHNYTPAVFSNGYFVFVKLVTSLHRLSGNIGPTQQIINSYQK